MDDDLWLVHPELRYVLEGNEAIREWSKAATFAQFLADGFACGPFYSGFANEFQGAIQQMLWDMEARAQEALRRARERATSQA